MAKKKLSMVLDRASRFVAAQPFFVRSIYAETLLEDFFVSAVAGLLAIRLYLAATGFPQLSIGTLHIAHIVWGGLLMLVALVMLLAFLNRRSQTIAAVVGGVGFGAFIDELGKFITSANDYFFRPAVAVIYVVFVLVFLATRAISRSRSFSPQHALANAFDVAMQAGLSGLDREHRDQALELLEDCSPGPVRQHLEAIIRSMQVAPRIHFRPVRHVLDLLDALYERVAQTWWFSSIVVGFFAITAVTGISAVLVVVEWSWSLALWLGSGLVILVALAWSRRVRMRYPEHRRGVGDRCIHPHRLVGAGQSEGNAPLDCRHRPVRLPRHLRCNHRRRRDYPATFRAYVPTSSSASPSSCLSS